MGPAGEVMRMEAFGADEGGMGGAEAEGLHCRLVESGGGGFDCEGEGSRRGFWGVCFCLLVLVTRSSQLRLSERQMRERHVQKVGWLLVCYSTASEIMGIECAGFDQILY